MIKNYFKTAWRSLRKNKLYAAINIFGLAIGLTACLLIGIYIHHELSYDTFNKNADRIVRVTMEYKNADVVNTTASTGTKVGPEFRRRFPAVEEYVRTFVSSAVIKNHESIFDEPRVLFADPAFFKVFSFKILNGDAATALDAPDKIVLTKSMAKKYFGNEDPLNKPLTAIGKQLVVSAICEDAPQNSQVKFDFVTQFLNLSNGVKEETWWNANWYTYLLLHNSNDIASLQKQVSAYMKTPGVKQDAKLEGNNYLMYHLEPLTSVHLHSTLAGFEPNGSMTYIYMFGIIGFLILVIASANYTNLSTAQSSGRGSEIGMRKVMGASRIQVFFQFMSESFVITAIAAVASFGLAVLLIPYFNSITGKSFSTATLLQPVPVITLILFSLLVSFLAGLYPALILSATKVIAVLKKGFTFTGGNGALRKSLIVIQFSISVFLIIYTAIIMKQMNYMQSKDLGYDKDHVVVLPVAGKMMNEFESIKSAIAGVPGVEAVTASYDTPEYVQWGDGISVTDEKGTQEISVTAMPVDLDFTATLKMKLIAGRDFQRSDFAGMDTSGNNINYIQPYIINESLARKIGWTPGQSLGKMIDKSVKGPVVGVVKDFNFSSLHDPIGPMLIFLGRDFSRRLLVRISGNDMNATINRLSGIWKERVPDRPFTYHFLDADYDKLYAAEQRSLVLFSVASALAIILACLGLFGLAAFTTIQRTKEIGIRRVLGASVNNITMLVATNFLQLVIISIMIAIPLAWWAGSKWLEDFAFRAPVGIYIFIATAIATILITLCTVSFHSVRAALSNPVKSLRTE